MPTAYTVAVADGEVTDFRTFALRCAREFGTAVMQRDDDPREPPKHREPSDYHTQEAALRRQMLADLDAMTLDDAARVCEAQYQAALAADAKYNANKDETRRRYEAMLAHVRAWRAPTADHEELKTFMVRQIMDSIAGDCTPYQGASSVERDPKKWLAEQRKIATQMVSYHTDEAERERQWCAEANAWIDALYASLPPKDGAP